MSIVSNNVMRTLAAVLALAILAPIRNAFAQARPPAPRRACCQQVAVLHLSIRPIP